MNQSGSTTVTDSPQNNRRQISRRDFLRLAGLTGAAALGTQAAFSPLNARLTIESDAAGRHPRPWWVRTVQKPTIEIDWDRMKRFDARDTVRSGGMIKYVDEMEYDRLTNVEALNEKQRILDEVPGYTLQDQALNVAQHHAILGRLSFLGPQRAPTPEARGVAKWNGTPEEASRILRTAMRQFGAATVGFVELDEKTHKLIYSHDPDGKQLVFEDVEEGSESVEKRVIPNKAQWVVVYTVQMSRESVKRAPTALAEQATNSAYIRGALIQDQTQEFLRGLGYQGLGQATVNALGIAPAFAVMAGLGELSRLNRLITPEYGPMVRVFFLVTDLPLATDQPIDAGIIEFCKKCKKCAEACPPSALSLEDEPTWEVRGGWNNPGHKAFFEDSVKCRTYMMEQAGTNCGICFAVCPFSKPDKAWIHKFVKATISTAPVADGFIRSMDDAFSYGAQKNPTTWWSLDLPEFGIDTQRTVKE